MPPKKSRNHKKQSPNQNVVEAEAFRLVKDGKVCASLGFDGNSSHPVLQFFEDGHPTIRIGTSPGNAFLEISEVNNTGWLVVGRHASGSFEIAINGRGGPVASLLVDGADNRSLTIYDRGIKPIFSVSTPRKP